MELCLHFHHFSHVHIFTSSSPKFPPPHRLVHGEGEHQYTVVTGAVEVPKSNKVIGVAIVSLRVPSSLQVCVCGCVVGGRWGSVYYQCHVSFLRTLIEGWLQQKHFPFSHFPCLALPLSTTPHLPAVSLQCF